MASPTRTSSALDTYVNAEKKDQAEGERFVAASGINGAIPEFAERQRRDNRKRWNKNATRTVEKDDKTVTEGQYVQAYHVIQSFARTGEGALDPNDPNQWEKAHALGVEMARKVAGRTRLATVHTQIDGTSGCIHNHLIIDSIDKQTGRSFNSAWVKHKKLVATHDQMLTEHGYTQVVEYPDAPGTKTAEKIEKSEHRALLKYRAWEAGGKQGEEPFSVAILKQRIRKALAETTFTSFEEFDELVLDRYNLDVDQRGGNSRGITYAMCMEDERGGLNSYPSARRRASKLGKNFEMDVVLAAIERNQQLQRQAEIDRQHQAAPATAPKRPLHEDEEATPKPARKPASKQPTPQPSPPTAAPRKEPTPPRTAEAAIQQALREIREEDDHQDTAPKTTQDSPAPPTEARPSKKRPPSLGSWADMRARPEEQEREPSENAANPKPPSASSEAPPKPKQPAADSAKTPQITEDEPKHAADPERPQHKDETNTAAQAPEKNKYQQAKERLAKRQAESGLDGPEQQDDRELE